MKMTVRFIRLRRMLRAEDLTPEAKRYRIYMEVESILHELPRQTLEEQRDIRAALHELGLLPDRRSGEDRRDRALESGQVVPAAILERRSGADRRQPRDLSEWLVAEE